MQGPYRIAECRYGRTLALATSLAMVALAGCADPVQPRDDPAEPATPDLSHVGGRPRNLREAGVWILNDVNDHGVAVGNGYDASGLAALQWTSAGAVGIPGFTDAYGINELGQIVGWGLTEGGRGIPLLWSAESGPINLGGLTPQSHSYAVSINESGVIVGYGSDAQLMTRPLRWTRGSGPHDLGTLSPHFFGLASDVNDLGEIVGMSSDSMGFYHAVLWTVNGDIVDLSGPSTSASAMGINNQSVVVGIVDTRAFRWTAAEGMVFFLDGIDNGFSIAFDINEQNVIVGSWLGQPRIHQGFRWDSATGLVPLALPAVANGEDLVTAAAVNACGTVVGSFDDNDRRTDRSGALVWPARCLQQ